MLFVWLYWGGHTLPFKVSKKEFKLNSFIKIYVKPTPSDADREFKSFNLFSFRKFKTLNILRLTMLGHISQYRLFKELLELHLFKGVAVKWSTVDHVIVSLLVSIRTLISWFPNICSWSSWDSSSFAVLWTINSRYHSFVRAVGYHLFVSLFLCAALYSSVLFVSLCALYYHQ